MSIKDTAKLASLKNTEQRIEAISQRQELAQSGLTVVTYQGHDPETGTAKFSKSGDCCESCSTITGGDVISTGAIAIGESVLARPTEGKMRIDRRPITANPSECGSAGSPSSRDFGGGSGTGVNGEPTTIITESFVCPAGQIKAGSRKIVGLAEQYEVYTGAKKTGLPIDGFPKTTAQLCETELVTVPNSEAAVSPRNPYAGINHDGCVKPNDVARGTLQRCQWYEVSQAEAENYMGAPEGMFVSGYVEYPEGFFRILACMNEDVPAETEGVGFEWNPANVLTSGSAIENTTYCSGIAQAEIRWDKGNKITQNPPIQYDLEMRQITIDGVDYQFAKELNNADPYTQNTVAGGIRVDWGGGDVEVLAGSSWTPSSTPTRYRKEFLVFTESALFACDQGMNSYYRFWTEKQSATYSVVPTLFNPNICGKPYYTYVWQEDGISLSNESSDELLETSRYGSTAGLPRTVTGAKNVFAYAYFNIQSVTTIQTVAGTYTITTDTGATSTRTTSTPPAVTIVAPTYQVTANFADTTTQEIYSSTTQPVSITVIRNYLKISDNTGQIAAYTYDAEPTNFTYACRTSGTNC